MKKKFNIGRPVNFLTVIINYESETTVILLNVITLKKNSISTYNVSIIEDYYRLMFLKFIINTDLPIKAIVFSYLDSSKWKSFYTK